MAKYRWRDGLLLPLIALLSFLLSSEILLQTAAMVVGLWHKPAVGPAPIHAKKIRILAVGDSTTALGGEESYPALLEQELKKKFPTHDWEVINAGLVAARSSHILSRMPELLEQYRPTMVLSLLGINDEWERAQLSQRPRWRPRTWELITAVAERIQSWSWRKEQKALWQESWLQLERAGPTLSPGKNVLDVLWQNGEMAQLEAAIERWPHPQEKWWWQLRWAQKNHYPDRALKLLFNAPDEARKNFQYQRELAMTYLDLGLADKAAQIINESLNQHPDAFTFADAQVYVQAMLAVGKVAEAKRTLARLYVLHFNPQQAGPWQDLLNQIYEKAGERPLFVRPQAPDIIANYAQLPPYWRQRLKAASLPAAQALRLAQAQFENLELDQALATFSRLAFSAGPERLPALLSLAALKLYQHQSLAARQLIQQYLRSSPRDEHAHLLLAQTYMEEKNLPKAAQILTNAISWAPQAPQLQMALAEIDQRHETTSALNGAAAPFLERARELNLEAISQLQAGSKEIADHYFAQAKEAFMRVRFTQVEADYRALASLLQEKKVLLLALQYPLRPLAQLENMLGPWKSAPHVLTVENMARFQQALLGQDYYSLFLDRINGDIGHCRGAGNALIAQAVAEKLAPLFGHNPSELSLKSK